MSTVGQAVPSQATRGEATRLATDRHNISVALKHP